MTTPKYLRTPAAAAYLGVSQSLLEKLRVKGTGPSYSKMGKLALYAACDLDDWVATCRRASTSETARIA